MFSSIREGRSLGYNLNQLLESVENRVGEKSETDAFQQVSLAIQNAQVAYAKNLSTTMDKVDEVIRGWIKDIEEKRLGSIIEFEAALQKWIRELPFSSRQPQLTHIDPKDTLLYGSDSYTVTFHGAFPYASKAGYQPSLSINNYTLLPFSTSQKRLDFLIPSILFEGVKMHQFSHIPTHLQIPWDNGWLLGPQDRQVSQYKVQLGAYPQSPGYVKISYTTRKVNRVSQRFASGIIEAKMDSLAQSPVRKFIVRPDEGWRVKTGSSKLTCIEAPGSHKEELLEESEEGVLYKCTLKEEAPTSFYIEFEEYQEVVEDTISKDTLELVWGESKVAKTTGKTISKIKFHAFDGKTYDLFSAFSIVPYITQHRQGEQVTFTA